MPTSQWHAYQIWGQGLVRPSQCPDFKQDLHTRQLFYADPGSESVGTSPEQARIQGPKNSEALCGSAKVSFLYHDGMEAFSRGRPRGARSLVPPNWPSGLGRGCPLCDRPRKGRETPHPPALAQAPASPPAWPRIIGPRLFWCSCVLAFLKDGGPAGGRCSPSPRGSIN